MRFYHIMNIIFWQEDMKKLFDEIGTSLKVVADSHNMQLYCEGEAGWELWSAAAGAAPDLIHHIKRLGNLLNLLFGDSHAFIFYLYTKLSMFKPSQNLDFSTFLRRFNRIIHQIVEQRFK